MPDPHGSSSDPHRKVPVQTTGAALDAARAAMILVHGRGASAASILTLAQELDLEGVAYLAPQAVGHTWYPHSFMAPMEQNEPGLSSALNLLGRLIGRVEAAGVSRERIALLGFSQGACLTTEFTVRHPKRYGGVFGLSGGLIGPEGTTFDYDGSMEDTPVFLGCSDRDPHIPLERVQETAAVFERLGADVEERIYEGMGHTVNQDEIAFVRDTMTVLVEGGATG
jgi:predicted esterase